MKHRPILAHVLFLLCVLLCLTGARGGKHSPVMFLAALCLIEAAVAVSCVRGKNARAAGDVGALLFLFFAVWQTVTHFGWVNPILFPTPEAVFAVFWTQRAEMAAGVLSSMGLLAVGFLLALPLGSVAGMAVGRSPRLRGAVLPAVRVLTPVSPIIYAPYLVAVMPSFRAAAAAVIFIGIFLPTLLSMSERAAHLDQTLLDTAQMLRLSRRETIFEVVVPYLFPSMLMSLRQSFSTSFMLLTMAEMLGSRTGMGYFIRKFADYADYTKVAAGILLVAAVITVLNRLLDRLSTRLVRWTPAP